MGEDYYKALVTYTKMTRWVSVHNNTECVKKTLNSEYWSSYDMINGADDDEDKFGLYLFLGIAIGAVVVIGALLLVIYLKRRKGDDQDEPIKVTTEGP